MTTKGRKVCARTRGRSEQRSAVRDRLWDGHEAAGRSRLGLPITRGRANAGVPGLRALAGLRNVLLALGVAAVAGCGVVYVSPGVPSEAAGVRVLPLTAESVLVANRAPYVPRALPAAFSRVAGRPDLVAAASPVPRGVTPRPAPYNVAPLIPPPPLERGPYMIGVGDVVLLATRPTTAGTVEELSGLLAAQNAREGYTVQDDGAIAIPDVGRVRIAGLSIDEAEDVLFEALVAAQIEPAFSLEVAEFNSQRVAVGGAVQRGAVVPITLSGLTLAEALAAGGGVAAPGAETTTIRIYRDGTIYQIPLDSYLSTPGLQERLLDAGDAVFVDTGYDLARAQAYFAEQIQRATFRQQSRIQALEELTAAVELRRASLEERRSTFLASVELDAVARDYVYLAGEVAEPSRFALPFDRQATLADALFAQGGFDVETANPSHIYVLRASPDPVDLGGVNAWRLDARNAVALTVATRMEMRPGDVIFIAQQPITRWNRSISQLLPQLVSVGGAVTD